MPLIVAAIIGGLISALGSLVGRVLVSLSLGYVVFSGVDTSLGWAKTQFLTNVSGLPAEAVGIMGVLKIGVCISMLFSAFTMRLLMQGLTGGSIKRMVTK